MTLRVVLVLVVFAGEAGVARASPKRAVPDYDGRGNEDQHAGSWALWIPRIVLSPLYVANEYLLRRPLGWLVTKAERDDWLDTAIEFFTFGPQHDYMLVPTGLFDFGLLSSVGLYFSGDNVLTPGNNIRIQASTGGLHAISATALDRYTFASGITSISARVDFRRRTDYLFFGLGPDVTDATQSRYGLEQLDAHTSLKRKLWASESGFGIAAGARAISYLRGDCCNEVALDDRIADGSLMPPPGYNTPYTSIYARADVTLDSRDPRPAPASGVYLKMHQETHFDVRNARSWVKYGGIVGAALDVNGRQRTVGVRAGASFVDPMKGEAPFNELASLGSDLMPGFVGGWMVGRSTFATQVSYTWPVSVWLDGEARLAMGNAFDEHLDGIAWKKMRLSGDVGVTTIGARDQGFEFLFGLGTETIEQGERITSVRLTFGSRTGF